MSLGYAVMFRYRSVKLSGKHFSYLIKKAFFAFVRVGLKIRGVIKFLQHYFLLCIYILGCPYVYMNQLVSLLIGIYTRKPLSFQSEYFSALSASRDLDLCSAVNGRHFYLCSENRIRK